MAQLQWLLAQRELSLLDSLEIPTAESLTVVAGVVVYNLGTQMALVLNYFIEFWIFFSSETFPSGLRLVERKDENTVHIHILKCTGVLETTPCNSFYSFLFVASLLDVAA